MKILPASSPLAERLRDPRPILLDGGLATELEARGHDLDDPLWSARLLLEAPEALGEVHRAFVEAGAEVVTAATYQASFEGLAARGLSRKASRALLLRGVAEARGAGARLTAASVGPYGAFLANGAEYSGDYPGMDEERLHAWHRPRFECLAEAGADLLACETVPSAAEARALARLLDETGLPGWLSFSCGPDGRLRDGTPLLEVLRQVLPLPDAVAVGVNCTAPRHVPALLGVLAAAGVTRPVVYPNSGERYDAELRRWTAAGDERGAEVASFARQAVDWVAAGAGWVGGCCRTGPRHIRALADALAAPPEPRPAGA